MFRDNKMGEDSSFKSYADETRSVVQPIIMDYIACAKSGASELARRYYDIVRDYPMRKSGYRRPALLRLTAQACGAKSEEAELPSAGIQTSEEFILIVDDWADKALDRRGEPTLHRRFNPALAINASIILHMIQWKMLEDYTRIAGKLGEQVYDKMYYTMLRTADGQNMDLNFTYEVKDMGKVTVETYLNIIKLKTVRYSVMDPMVIGGMIGRQPKPVLDMLEEVGAYAGTTFQLKDDSLDFTADEKKFGKQKYGDLYEGKLSAPKLFAFQVATESERAFIKRVDLKDREKKTPDEIATIVDIINKHDGVGKTKDLIEIYGMQAEIAFDKLAKLLPENRYKDILRSGVRELYMRDK